MLKPSKEFIITVSILVVVIAAIQLFLSPRSPFSQSAKVGGGEALLFSSCDSDTALSIQNSGFESLVPGFILPIDIPSGEVCHWYGGVFPGYSASFGNPGAYARMNYVRHGYHPDWDNFLNIWNSSSSDGIMQKLQSPLSPGEYVLSFDRRLVSGTSGSMIIGLASDPLSGDVGTTAGCDYFDTGSLMTTTAQNAHATDMENCLIAQFDKLIFSSSVNDSMSESWETVTFPFTITPGEAADDLQYLYFFPWGNDPEYYVPVGEGDKPYFELGIDNVELTSVAQSACAASSLTLTDTAPVPTFKNQSGDLVSVSAGAELSLGQVDYPLITPSAFGSQYNYDSPAVLVQRIGNNKIAVTPANPETVYTVSDIQSMFGFENTVITDMQAVLEMNLGDLFGSAPKESFFARLTPRAHANIQLTTYIVTIECQKGGNGEYTGFMADIPIKPAVVKPLFPAVKIQKK